VPGGERGGELRQFDVQLLRCAAQDFERLVGADAAPVHQDAFGLPDHVPAVNRLAQVRGPQVGVGQRLRMGKGEAGMGGEQERGVQVASWKPLTSRE
jgi:hypothetical protein